MEVRAGAETVAETVGAQQLASRASGLGNEEGAPRQSLSLLAPLNRFQNFPLPCPWAVRIRPETRSHYRSMMTLVLGLAAAAVLGFLGISASVVLTIDSVPTPTTQGWGSPTDLAASAVPGTSHMNLRAGWPFRLLYFPLCTKLLLLG